MKRVVYLVITLLFVYSCSSTDKYSESGAIPSESAKMDLIEEPVIGITRQLPTEENTKDVLDKSQIQEVPKIKQPDKIIKEAFMSIEVKNYRKSKVRIDSLVNKWGGYIASEDERSNHHQISNDIVIRVHSSMFENLLNAIGETKSKVDYKKVNTIDVSEEYVDIVSRLKTKREVMKRYESILKKATKVEDILKVENEIRVIREEIEAKEGRLRFLQDRISYSTINLTVYQELEYKYQPDKKVSFFSKFYKGLDKGWKGLLSFVIALAHIWPILLIMGVILFFVLRSIKKEK